MTLSGKGVLKGVKIDPKLADPAETEMLEDLLLAAHADAKSKLDELTESEMKNRDRRDEPAGGAEAALLNGRPGT